ncbi:hypothetical protein [Lentzea sp. NEAU-D7]|uniref:hypothetical protein n=1 Tax=Lentzea sp. NEAU-D7 TaxID=2994667 RepID=UPI00224B1784|nr:hypothetical protein [Lentzea sp. NEAU-D7]MCX2948720.1 hypothetical protein [Lentzea sp. NEAU-D7]MCX2951278.1 hypothetical protein [Lentzea sp. NEAU-D7]
MTALGDASAVGGTGGRWVPRGRRVGLPGRTDMAARRVSQFCRTTAVIHQADLLGGVATATCQVSLPGHTTTHQADRPGHTATATRRESLPDSIRAAHQTKHSACTAIRPPGQPRGATAAVRPGPATAVRRPDPTSYRPVPTDQRCGPHDNTAFSHELNPLDGTTAAPRPGATTLQPGPPDSTAATVPGQPNAAVNHSPATPPEPPHTATQEARP